MLDTCRNNSSHCWDEIVHKRRRSFSRFNIEKDWRWQRRITGRCLTKINSISYSTRQSGVIWSWNCCKLVDRSFVSAWTNWQMFSSSSILFSMKNFHRDSSNEWVICLDEKWTFIVVREASRVFNSIFNSTSENIFLEKRIKHRTVSLVIPFFSSKQKSEMKKMFEEEWRHFLSNRFHLFQP